MQRLWGLGLLIILAVLAVFFPVYRPLLLGGIGCGVLGIMLRAWIFAQSQSQRQSNDVIAVVILVTTAVSLIGGATAGWLSSCGWWSIFTAILGFIFALFFGALWFPGIT